MLLEEINQNAAEALQLNMLNEEELLSFYGLRDRYYDAATARFISEDPIRHASGDANLFMYVGNNPVNRLDPSGQKDKPKKDQQKEQTDPSDSSTTKPQQKTQDTTGPSKPADASANSSGDPAQSKPPAPTPPPQPNKDGSQPQPTTPDTKPPADSIAGSGSGSVVPRKSENDDQTPVQNAGESDEAASTRIIQGILNNANSSKLASTAQGPPSSDSDKPFKVDDLAQLGNNATKTEVPDSAQAISNNFPVSPQATDRSSDTFSNTWSPGSQSSQEQMMNSASVTQPITSTPNFSLATSLTGTYSENAAVTPTGFSSSTSTGATLGLGLNDADTKTELNFQYGDTDNLGSSTTVGTKGDKTTPISTQAITTGINATQDIPLSSLFSKTTPNTTQDSPVTSGDSKATANNTQDNQMSSSDSKPPPSYTFTIGAGIQNVQTSGTTQNNVTTDSEIFKVMTPTYMVGDSSSASASATYTQNQIFGQKPGLATNTENLSVTGTAMDNLNDRVTLGLSASLGATSVGAGKTGQDPLFSGSFGPSLTYQAGRNSIFSLGVNYSAQNNAHQQLQQKVNGVLTWSY